MKTKNEECPEEVILLVDHKNKMIYDLTPVADQLAKSIGTGNMLTDIREMTADMAFNFLQIACQNKNETIAENILEVAFDIHLMRLFERVNPVKERYEQFAEALNSGNMACRTDQQ